MTATCLRIRIWANTAVIALFVVGLGLPFLGTVLQIETGRVGEVVRKLDPMPPLALKRSVLRAYHCRLDFLMREFFGFRSTLIRWMSHVRYRWMGMSSAQGVVLGRDSWIYLMATDPDLLREGARPLRLDELAHWQYILERRRDWCARHGIHYLFVVAPEKQTIYPEHLPKSHQGLHTGGRIGQLVDYLRSHSSLEVIDLRGPLWQAKQFEQIYHMTDSHWNDRGAFIAYQYVASQLGAWFPAIRALPRSAFVNAWHEAPGDVTYLLHQQNWIRERMLDLQPLIPRQAKKSKLGYRANEEAYLVKGPFVTECPNPALPRAVVLHDSFVLCSLQPLLSEHFRRAVFAWENAFDMPLIEREHPDVVIQEMAERKLTTPVPGETPEENR